MDLFEPYLFEKTGFLCDEVHVRLLLQQLSDQGLEGPRLCSVQLSMKFILLINVKCQQLLAF